MTQTTSLTRNPEFVKLWVGQTISVFGSEITNLALPLTAVLILQATPGQMGVLGAMGMLPFLLVGLFAGVWADRMRRRPILMMADFGRFVLLVSIPVALLAGFLTIEYLYIVTFLIGVLTVFFDVSYQAFLPALVGREHLVEGNSKLEITNSAAQIVGPGIAGALIQALTAPVAIIFDAVSFLLSAISLRLIRDVEEEIHKDERPPNIWREIREGLGVIFGNRLLWSIAGCTGTGNLFGSVWNAIFLLYLTRDLNMPPAILGIIFAAGAPGALLGALFASRVAKRVGLGRTIVGSALLIQVMAVPVLFSGNLAVVVALLIISGLGRGFGNVVYNVNQVSLRQAITPNRLLGRMNASMRFLVWGTIPIGSLIGGALGEAIGLRPTILVGVVGGFLSVAWVFFSPVRMLVEQPAAVEE
jgi:MFS family permease